MPSQQIQIQVKKVLERTETEELWAFYDHLFAPLNRACPCRQSFWKKDFVAAAVDPSFFKLLAFKGRTIVGISFCTFDLTKVSWVSPDFYWKPWPCNGRTIEMKGKICYIVSIGVAPEERNLRVSLALMRTIDQIVRDRDAVGIAFDFSAKMNSTLPSLISRFTRAKPVGQYPQMGNLPAQMADFQGQCFMLDLTLPAFQP